MKFLLGTKITLAPLPERCGSSLPVDYKRAACRVKTGKKHGPLIGGPPNRKIFNCTGGAGRVELPGKSAVIPQPAGLEAVGAVGPEAVPAILFHIQHSLEPWIRGTLIERLWL